MKTHNTQASGTLQAIQQDLPLFYTKCGNANAATHPSANNRKPRDIDVARLILKFPRVHIDKEHSKTSPTS